MCGLTESVFFSFNKISEKQKNLLVSDEILIFNTYSGK